MRIARTTAHGLLGMLASAAFLSFACSALSKNGNDDMKAAAGTAAATTDETAPFADGEWELRVNRAWDGVSGEVTSPSDDIPEPAYKPDARGIVYRIVASADATHVVIGEEAIEGDLSGTKDSSRSYELMKGTFAGGRFKLWTQGNALEGELTIYGSGRPLVKSERGSISRVR